MNEVRRTSGQRPNRSWLLVAVAVTLGVCVVALVGVATDLTGVPAATFTRDVSASAGVAWYTGSVSVLNLVLWGVAAALAAFVAALHRRHRAALLLFAAVSLALLADDALLLHEVVGPWLRVPELLFFVGYATVGVVLALLLRPTRAGTAGWALLGSGALLAGSIVTDVLAGDSFFAEDGLKLVGTAVWVTVPVLVHLQAERLQARIPLDAPRAARRPPVRPASVVDPRGSSSEGSGARANARASR